VKIGRVDTEIALLKLKKKETVESKIYSPSGKFAKRAKKIEDGGRPPFSKT